MLDSSFYETMAAKRPRATAREAATTADRAHELAPAGAFDTERGNAEIRRSCGVTTDETETGPDSRTVRNRIARSCAGWPDRPTGREFYEAIRAPRPTERQRCLISMWMLEATDEDVILAWAEEAYTLRDLVAAAHRAGAQDDNPARNDYLNTLKAL